MSRIRRAFGWLTLLVALAACAGGAWQFPRAPKLGVAPGVKLGGASLAPGQPIAPQIERRVAALKATRVTLLGQGESAVEASLEELGLQVDIPELVRRAERVGRHGSWLERWEEMRAARFGLIDLPLPYHFDRVVFASVLDGLKEAQDRPGVDARFELTGLGVLDPKHPLPESPEVVPDRPGVYLDVDVSVDALLVALRRGERKVALVDVQISPQLSVQALSKIGMQRVVAQYSSRFSRGGDADNRATNIETAAKRLDGVVLPPGELVSFNALVGARTLDNGFRPGWEIFRGEMVRGIGGGTCQVSSTLHAAAVYGGLDIVERAPHSRPSAYMPLGLDSTVAWPSVDLKVKNPWSEPLVVHTVVKGNELIVQLLGAEQPASVRWHTETLAILPFKRKVTESSWLSEGTVIKKQKGIRGYRLRRVREFALADGTSRVEETVDVYPPTDEHFIVPPGAELSDLLPPPAEGSVEARDQAASEAAEAEQSGVVIATQQPFEP
ncbi:MAG: VanW family protein [Polyangiaceae bacterium]|nr:VanW family protein [Polyangiaceae bacterium]